MVVQQEDSLCANGDNHCVLQGVVDYFRHLMMVKMMILMTMTMMMLTLFLQCQTRCSSSN